MSGSNVISDSELTEMIMDMNAHNGRIISNRIASGEGSQLDNWELRLLTFEQSSLRRKWADELEQEGWRVRLFEPSAEKVEKNGMRITNRAADVVTVWLYGPIGGMYGGISDVEFQQKFEEIPSDAHVALRIKSDGGDFFTALAMREVIISRLGRTVAYVDGMAASAATLVACACSKIVMGIGAKFMIHEASAEMKGRVNDFEFAADELRKTNATIEKIYSDRWKGTTQELRKALRDETWFDAYQAIEVGLADEVSEKLTAAAQLTSDFPYKSIPAELRIAAKAKDCPRLMACELMFHRLATVR